MVRVPLRARPGAACTLARFHRAIVLQSTRKVHRRDALDRKQQRSIQNRQNGQVRAVHSVQPKRLLDLTLGTLLLLLAAPLLAAAACSTALGRPPGGVFVRELKTGLHGYPFTVRSLRTRRWRLDLLSRLPHVLRGEMSLVGPAALAPDDPRAAVPWRQTVRPGLTGPAQLRRHSSLPWDEPELLDQDYVEHHWIGLDMAVLARTIPALRPPRTQGHLSDADHRLPGYSATE